MTKDRMIEMLNTINEMIARSEERQRLLKEMIDDIDVKTETLETVVSILEK